MARIFIKTYGCTLNQSDSEVMAGILKSAGHEIVHGKEGREKADIIVINTCTVKDAPEKKFWYELKTLPKNKKIIVAGCIAQSDHENPKLKNISLVGTRQIHKIKEAVEQIIAGKTAKFIDLKHNARLNLPKLRKNRFVEIIPINAGCTGDCTYCKTKQARGELFSYPASDIEKQFCNALNEGVKEIWLTSQDTGAYGLDIKTGFAELLERLLKYKGDYRIRIGMLNPNHLLKIKDKLLPLIRDSAHVYKFLHMPLQSGSNKVLKDMNRLYTKEEYASLIAEMRENILGITIATDIICGFPSETEQDFEQTLEFCRKIKFDIINISKFFPRKGTRAAAMKKLSTNAVKQRSSVFSDWFFSNCEENNRKWIGWKGRAYFYEKGKEGTIIGKNIFYRQIVVHGDDALLGKELEVEITDVGMHDLKGRIV
ncbi:MAG: tRNA (N(6)-L-threonylcarbamoyladenosine(37)-C(2))-methylthiotransferase [Candidatus Woesearchaeota archaeon]